MKDWFKEVGRAALALLLGLLAVAAIVGLFWADFAAYRQRFPHADLWTYFFQ